MRIFSTAVVLGWLSLASGWERDAADIQKEYRQVKATHAAGWLDRAWGLTAEWAIAYLDGHPEVTEESLQTWMDSLDPAPCETGEPQETDSTKPKPDCEPNGIRKEFYTTVEELGGRAFVIAAGYQEVDCEYGPSVAQYGTFFVVSQRNGKYSVAWRVRDSRDKRLAGWKGARPELWALCLHPLPPTDEGHPRFWVDGGVTHAAGFTMGGQLSVWEWDGAQAVPLVVTDYLFVMPASEEDAPVKQDGDLLRIHTKERFRHFMVYGVSRDPEGERTIRVTPRGVQDLGVRRLHPEVDVVDELYDRIAHGRAATDLASPEAIAVMTRSIQAGENRYTTLEDWRLQGAQLCLATDLYGGNRLDRHVFTFSHSGGKLFVNEIQDPSAPELGETCDDVLARAGSRPAN